jgi:Leucine-rich repeat (LRR) protein
MLYTRFQVLDLSFNRIRELKYDSFASLTDLKYLYLFENMITHIDDDTFRGLVKLEALDLSSNNLREVPTDIFFLLNLRNLHVSNNPRLLFDNIPTPIKAPLQVLSLARTGMDKIPSQFGVLPELYTLNISSNYLRNIKPQDFSPFCHLHEVDLNETRWDECTCLEVRRYLENRGIVLSSVVRCNAIESSK